MVLAGNDVPQSNDNAPKLNPQGTPYAVMVRRLMEECGTLAEADKLIQKHRATTTASAILCDSKSGTVYEVTPKNVIARKANDGICSCTNHFLAKELALPQLCSRLEILDRYAKKPKLSLDDVKRALHEVNQDTATIQSIASYWSQTCRFTHRPLYVAA